MAEKTSLGVLLKRYRLEAGLSQEALAGRANLSTRAVSDLERGLHRAPHHETLEALVAALSLSSHQRTLLLAAARPELQPGTSEPASLLPPALPLSPTPLVGREQELLRASTILNGQRGRLLTITGPGGVGKTRLALEIARKVASQFSDGVAFVDLAPLRDAALVPDLVAQTLSLKEQPGSSSISQVRLFLRDRHILLLLDNMEHLPDSASFVAELLAWCPDLRVLATGRSPLHLRGEQELPLAPLSPEEAILLFRERVHQVRPEREYAEDEIASLCGRLDCLPLAIELAAVRVKVLSLAEIKELLMNRLGLLRGGPRDLPARQQTIRDTIAWSYDLLTEAQKRYFRALGVFAGGGTLEAARAVGQAGEASAQEGVLALADLVDASLVQMELPARGEGRFRLLELVGEFALERLAAAGEEEGCRARHAAYYAGLAARLVPFGPGREVAEKYLAQDFANVRAALEWAESRSEVALGVRLVAGFGRIWISRGQISEAIRWYERMLALVSRGGGELPPPEPWSEAVYDYCYALLTLGQLERAESVAGDALKQAEQHLDHNALGNYYGLLGRIAQQGGQLDRAETYFAESESHARQAGNASNPRMLGTILLHRADIARLKGKLGQARSLYEELLTIVGNHGSDWLLASVNTLLGQVAFQERDYKLALARYREALTLSQGFGSPTLTAWCLEGYAALLGALEQFAPATRLCAAAGSLRDKAQTPLPSGEREAFEDTVAKARSALPLTVFEEEWKRGTALTGLDATNYALSVLNNLDF